MIRHAPMGTIRRPSDSGSRVTEATSFIQCINGREPQIHDLWYMDLDGISCKVHYSALLKFPAGTIGEFVTDNLAENGSRIDIIGQLYVNDSVQFLGFTDQSGGSGWLFIYNLLACIKFTGKGSGNYYNQ